MTSFENMEGDEERKQGSSPHDPTLERALDRSGLNSTNQLLEESTSNSSLNGVACGIGPTEASSMFAGPSLAAEAGEVLERSTRQRTAPAEQENLVRDAMEFQGRGGTIQFQSHGRVPGQQAVWDENHEDDSDDDMRLDIDGMSYEELLELEERIGNVSTGLREEVIREKLKKRKYRCSTMGSPVDAEACCICQEEYADDEDVGKLDCGHEHHVACIVEWLSKKNSCPICKKTALAV